MRDFHPLAAVGIFVLIVGGLNWGLVGLFNFDLVGYLFGTMSVLSRIVYLVVGLSALGIALWLPATACGCPWCVSKVKSTVD